MSVVDERPGYSVRTARVVADRSAPRNARLFVAGVLEELFLVRVDEDAQLAVSELSTWLLRHDPGGIQQIAVVRDEGLVMVEAADGGTVRPAGADEGGDMQMVLLDAVCFQWGSELRDGGRCLWASFRLEPGVLAVPAAGR